MGSSPAWARFAAAGIPRAALLLPPCTACALRLPPSPAEPQDLDAAARPGAAAAAPSLGAQLGALAVCCARTPPARRCFRPARRLRQRHGGGGPRPGLRAERGAAGSQGQVPARHPQVRV